MLTVGPGDISAYGTGINNPAMISTMNIRVEASSVAVRRGMERQYGTGMTTGPRGRPYGAGPRAAAYGDGRQAAGSDAVGAGSETERCFSIASRNRA
ncbi:putative ligase [Streptomyces sp. NBRC 110611]|nr:putative ligase [Streptomyces sp. NBRC 110611]